MRRLIVATLALAIAAPSAITDPELGRRAMAFERHWNLFIRRLAGCPDDGPIGGSTCVRGGGRVDYAEFLKARNAAKILFDFHE